MGLMINMLALIVNLVGGSMHHLDLSLNGNLRGGYLVMHMFGFGLGRQGGEFESPKARLIWRLFFLFVLFIC